ncbi:MAG: glycosyl hydrolase family 18 protein [Ginsengibacter sp.]
MKNHLYLFCLVICFSQFANGQKKGNGNVPAFKVVGYYFLHTALLDTSFIDSNYSFLDKITHLNIAFINPDTNGVFNNDLRIDTLIARAHKKNVKVLGSLAGGGRHDYFHKLLNDENRENFIENILGMLKRYHLDGIDVDIEGEDIDSNYVKFVVSLSKKLKIADKLITAAIATAYKDELPDKALKEYDFVNIMSYDQRGPWRPQEPGDHAPYTMAVFDLDYWHRIRKLPKEKLILGLPFYGYGFGPRDTAISMDYRHISEEFPARNISDTFHLPDGIVMYYNNEGTIKLKTQLAIKQAGGIMIWQLTGDSQGEKSLLNLIYNTIHQKKKE